MNTIDVPGSGVQTVTIRNLTSVIDAPQHHGTLTMFPDDKAPRLARSFTREMLVLWELEDLLDRTVLIVSELTTNAGRHGSSNGTTDEHGTERPAGGAEQITLTLTAQPDVVGIQVEDNSALSPVPRAPSLESIDGRGLQLVSAEADAWGIRPTANGHGKRVLAFVRRPAADSAL